MKKPDFLSHRHYLLFCCILSAILLFTPIHSYSAFMPLEIINIKPAGTGSPAIPSTNRIFRAYPGIEYNIRAAVIGGAYPFLYSLSNAPAGMTINQATGEIIWPNPQSNASNIQLTVTDSEGTSVQTTWSITVSTSGFYFIDQKYSGIQTGTITQPYSTLASFMSSQKNNPNAIVYFRGGGYSYPSGYNWINEQGISFRWLGYPGEQAVINMNDRHVATGAAAYIDNLTFINMDYWGVVLYGPTSYQTIRRSKFDDFTNSNSAHDNQGVIMVLGSEGIAGSYSVIQDNLISNFRASAGNISAIGSLYRMQKFLIENNYIHSTSTGNSDRGIYTKTNTSYFSIRGNKILIANGVPVFSGNYTHGTNYEFTYNLLVRTGSRNGIYQAYEWYQGNTLWKNNTIVADFKIRACQQTGPYTITNNIFINPNTSFDDGTAVNFINYDGGTSNCFTISNHLGNTDINSLINLNDEYKLISSQATYIGTRGWQLPDGSTPMEKSYSAPGVQPPGDQPPVIIEPPPGLKLLN